MVIQGVTADDGTVQSVRVNGREARRLAPNFLEWEAVVEEPTAGPLTLTATAQDAAGNVERAPPSGYFQESADGAPLIAHFVFQMVFQGNI